MAKSNYKKRMRRICQKKTGQISAKLQQFKRIQWAPLEQERYIEWNLGLVNQEWHSSKPLGIHHHHHHIFYICKYIYISLFNPSGFAGRIGFFHPWTPKSLNRFKVAWIMEMWKITYEQRRILGWEFMWTCLFHKGFTSWRRQIYVYIYVYINHHGRVTPRWSGYNLLWSKLQHPCAGWCVSTPLSCLKKRQANQHSLSAAVEQLLVWRSDGHMIIHLQPLQRCSWSIISMDGVHHLHGWCASSLWSLKWSMRLHKIASRKRILKEDTVYSMIATSCCHVLTYTESYDGLFFWCHYISDHTSKIIQYEKSWVSTMWNFPKAEKGEQEYWICQQQTNDQTAKKCNQNHAIDYTNKKHMYEDLTNHWMAMLWYFSGDQYSSWKAKTVYLEVFDTSCNFGVFETMLLPSRKPTWQWKLTISESAYILKLCTFHCHILVSGSTDGKPLNLSEFCASPLPKEVVFISRCKNPMCFEGKLLWLLC